MLETDLASEGNTLTTNKDAAISSYALALGTMLRLCEEENYP
jgi:hypothetical protein